mmetsp:Transcript_41631/g.134993  ORF Transcript_41631/g.134993 Transcript_41631/m.134993 type:complete len:218 (-) Transcript_41631:1107-1760(-)
MLGRGREGLTDDPVWKGSRRGARRGAEAHVQPVMRARDSIVDRAARDADRPAPVLKVCTRVAEPSGELIAMLTGHRSEREPLAPAGSVDHLPAKVEVAQLRRPEGGRDPFALCAADPRNHVHLGDEGAVDDQLAALLQPEGAVLDLDVASEVRSGEEGVVGAVLAAKVSAAAMRKVEVRVLISTSAERGHKPRRLTVRRGRPWRGRRRPSPGWVILG